MPLLTSPLKHPRSRRWRQTLVILGLVLGLTIGLPSLAKDMHSPASDSTSKPAFPTIEQPFSHRAIVTIGGVTLICAELWWFLGSSRFR